jgi:hypothetical protein
MPGNQHQVCRGEGRGQVQMYSSYKVSHSMKDRVPTQWRCLWEARLAGCSCTCSCKLAAAADDAAPCSMLLLLLMGSKRTQREAQATLLMLLVLLLPVYNMVQFCLAPGVLPLPHTCNHCMSHMHRTAQLLLLCTTVQTAFSGNSTAAVRYSICLPPMFTIQPQEASEQPRTQDSAAATAPNAAAAVSAAAAAAAAAVRDSLDQAGCLPLVISVPS